MEEGKKGRKGKGREGKGREGKEGKRRGGNYPYNLSISYTTTKTLQMAKNSQNIEKI